MNPQDTSTTTPQPPPTPTPWVGYPHRVGERSSLPLTFSLLGPGSSWTGLHTEVALWRYAPTGDSADEPARRPRLLMIHGFRGDHHGMQLIVDALPDYEVLVPDLPGFGQTPPVRGASGRRVEHSVDLYAGLVARLSQQLDLGADDVLMGHSFGTTIASAHIAKHQRQWAGLVLSAPISDGVFSGPMLPGASAVELYYWLSRLLPERSANALLRSAAILGLTNLTMIVETDPAVQSYVRDQHRQFFGSYADRQTLWEAYWASSRHTVADYAQDLHLPVALLPGTQDQLSTRTGRRRLRAALPQGHMEMLRGAGHLLHYEKPAQLARAMRRFLRAL